MVEVDPHASWGMNLVIEPHSRKSILLGYKEKKKKRHVSGLSLDVPQREKKI